MNNRAISAAILCALAGGVLGFHAYRSTSTHREPSDRSTHNESTQFSSSSEATSTYLDQRLKLESVLLSSTSSVGAKMNALRKMDSLGISVSSALFAMAKKDPEAYIRFESQVEMDHDWNLSSPLSWAFREVFKTNPILAESLAVSYPDPKGRRQALDAIVNDGIVNGNSVEADRLLATYSSHLSEGFFQTYPETPYESLSRALSKLPNTRHSAEIARNFAIGWFSKDPAAAKTWIKALPKGTLQDFTFSYMMQHLLHQESTTQAVELYAELKESAPGWQPDSGTLATISEHLFEGNAAGGIQWANENLPLSARAQHYKNTASKAFDQGGIEAAMELIPLLPPSQQNTIVEAVAGRLAGWNDARDPFQKNEQKIGDWSTALEWLDTLTASQAKVASDTIASGWASGDIESAKAYIQDTASDPFPKLAEEIAVQWVKEEPEAAVVWAQSLDANQSGDALPNAINEWANHHALDAAQYVLTLPEGTSRTSLVSSVARKLFNSDLNGSEQWLRSITNASDKAAARNSINAVSPEIRDRLLEALVN